MRDMLVGIALLELTSLATESDTRARLEMAAQDLVTNAEKGLSNGCLQGVSACTTPVDVL